MKTYIPDNYVSKLSLYQTQLAISDIKRIFESNLSKALNLRRVSAPLFVTKESGLNDDLNGVESPVKFSLKNDSKELQIVHSLAKWKRMALSKYSFSVGEGIYTDMNAIRKDEDLDNIHSIYVDQWDWEKVISEEERCISYLKETVRNIVKSIAKTSDELRMKYKELSYKFNDDVFFITTKELEDMYPNLTPKERENAIVKVHSNVFLMQIGKKLSNGLPHDNRAPDYDDWELNGDLLTYNKVLDIAFELSSMGIRVNSTTLKKQLSDANCLERLNLEFHNNLINNKLPLTIGGGIGQSRLSMLLLEKAHIGEVQVSVWDKQTIEYCVGHKVKLL